MANVTKRLATDDGLKAIADAIKNTESVQQAKAEIQAEGAVQVQNVQIAAQEIAGKVEQIQNNTDGITELKSDIANSREAITELADKKITKFYANNLGETTLNDSDNGKIQDMMLYGKSEQKSYTGKNLWSGLNTGKYWLGSSNVNDDSISSDFIPTNGNTKVYVGFSYDWNIGYSTFDSDKNLISSRALSNGGTTTKGNYASTASDFSADTDVAYIRVMFYKNENVPYVSFIDGEYEPYVGGIQSPNPDYPQEIQSVVNPVVEVSKGSTRYITKTQWEWLRDNYNIWHNNNYCVFRSMHVGDVYVIDKAKIEIMDRKAYGYCIDRLGNYSGYEHMTIYSDENILSIYSTTNTIVGGYDGNFNDINVPITSASESIGIYGSDSDYPLKTTTLPYTLNAIPVESGGNVTIDGQKYIADYVDIENKQIHRFVDSSKLDPTISIVENTDLLLSSEEVSDLTDEEVQAFKELSTYYPTTNVLVTSDQLGGYTTFNYPLSMDNGWNLIKEQLGDTREYIYDMDLQSAEAYINSEYAVALAELEV